MTETGVRLLTDPHPALHFVPSADQRSLRSNTIGREQRGIHEARPAVRVPAEARAVEGAAPVRAAARRAADLRRGDRADPARRQARASTPSGPSSTTSATAGSACPTSEAVLGGLALSTTNIRLGFGVVLMPFGFIHPARVAEKVATVDILSHGRVEWGTGRSTPMEQIAFGVPDRQPLTRRVEGGGRDRRAHVGGGALLLRQPELLVPRAHADAEAVPGPAPAVLARGGDRHERRQRRRATGSGCSRSRCCSRSRTIAEHVAGLPRSAVAECDAAAHARDERPRRRVHARALRGRHGRGRELRPLGLGELVVPAPRRVHARVGAAHT